MTRYVQAKVNKIFGRARGNGQIIQVELKIKNKLINRNLIGDVKVGDFILLLNPDKEDKVEKIK